MLPSRRQQLVASVIGLINFFSAICVSLQSPFYPDKALEKGATSTQYGLVFGVFELTVFIVSPIIGKYLVDLGIRRCFIWGTVVTGFCCVIFGLLDVFKDPTLFVTSGIIIRICEALGNSAFITASFSIIAQEFSGNLATMFSAIEMCFGFGLIVGPTMGAYLYVMGGFFLPFVVLGTLLLVSALLAQFILPEMVISVNSNPKIGVFKAISFFPIQLACLAVFAASVSLGFLQVNLEPKLKEFDTSTITIGLIFMLNGATYALSAPIFGWICDKKISPKLIGILGNALITISIAIAGPVPFLPIPKDYVLVVVALAIHGVGLGAALVSGFSDAHQEALNHGLDNNIHTYGVVSGLWASTFALGAFIGPTAGGYLKDEFGFGWSSIIVLLFTVLSFIASGIYVASSATCKPHRTDEKMSIINNDGSTDYGTLEEGSLNSSSSAESS